MIDLQPHLDYLDKYLGSGFVTAEQKAIIEAFAGKKGTYLETRAEYHSRDFRALAFTIFRQRIGEELAAITLSQDFKKVAPKELLEGLEKLERISTLHVGGEVQKISEERWNEGERGTLSANYSTLRTEYEKIRAGLAGLILEKLPSSR